MNVRAAARPKTRASPVQIPRCHPARMTQRRTLRLGRPLPPARVGNVRADTLCRGRGRRCGLPGGGAPRRGRAASTHNRARSAPVVSRAGARAAVLRAPTLLRPSVHGGAVDLRHALRAFTGRPAPGSSSPPPARALRPGRRAGAQGRGRGRLQWWRPPAGGQGDIKSGLLQGGALGRMARGRQAEQRGGRGRPEGGRRSLAAGARAARERAPQGRGLSCVHAHAGGAEGPGGGVGRAGRGAGRRHPIYARPTHRHRAAAAGAAGSGARRRAGAGPPRGRARAGGLRAGARGRRNGLARGSNCKRRVVGSGMMRHRCASGAALWVLEFRFGGGGQRGRGAAYQSKRILPF
jgi:hypothetical protein